jgi:hypothetical protein
MHARPKSPSFTPMQAWGDDATEFLLGLDLYRCCLLGSMVQRDQKRLLIDCIY